MEDIHGGALNECLGIVYISVNFRRGVVETVWTITPTSIVGSTFGIAYNDNTKNNRGKEEKDGVGDGDQAQHMT